MNIWTRSSLIFLLMGSAHCVGALLCIQAGEHDLFVAQGLGGIFYLLLAMGFLIKGEISG